MTGSAAGFLVLHPADAAWAPAHSGQLASLLRETGLIGASRGTGIFSTGAHYLALVSYLGCSPYIALGDAEAATRIQLLGPFATARFHAGANLKPPRCPRCRKALPGAAWQAGQPDTRVVCPHCDASVPLEALDWRRSAGFGRCFVEISNVFESEAVPAETLLERLEQASGCGWHYFYLTKT